MTKVKDIYNYIDSFAPFNTSADFDNTGILVGDGNIEVTKAVAALDITADVVKEASNLGAQLIVSHHPVIFSQLKKLEFGSVPALLAANGIAALCAHTNLDKSAEFGTNTCLAESSGLFGCKNEDISEFLFTAKTPDILTAAELAEQIKRGLDCKGIYYTAVNNEIQKVGFCSGAGGCEIFAAAQCGCDAFITGEIKHHEILAANDMGISIFCVGHYKSEDAVITPLCKRLAQKFPDVEFVKSKVFTDAVEFFTE